MAVVGVMTETAYDVIGKDKENLQFTEPLQKLRELVPQLKKEGADAVILLSHGGTLNKDDLKIAKWIDGIDLIISGHDHDLLHTPMFVNNTPIVAAGAYGEYIGKIVLQRGKLLEYKLLETSKASENPQMCSWVDSMQRVVDNYFFQRVGVNLQDSVATLAKDLPKRVDAQGRMELGEFVAKSYREAAIENLQITDTSAVIGIVPYGVVRSGLKKGKITNRDIFNTLSLGYNEGGYTGYPLVYGWLTGAEIENLCELNASIAPYLEDTRLFFSGVEYNTGKWRLPFFKVKEVQVNGRPLCKEKRYMVVTGKYTAELIGMLKRESFGILSAQVKDSSGAPLPPDKIPHLRTPNGREITEWEAFAEHLKNNAL